MNNNNEYVIDPKEQAKIVNEYLATVFTTSAGEIPTKEEINPDAEISDVEINESRVKSIIENMKENTAPGPDGIPAKLLLELKNEIAVPLTILFRKSMDSGKIPEDW